MSHGFTPLRRRFERLFATLSAVAVLMSIMVIFAPAALAHHPEVSAFQICLEQRLAIQYDAISWRTDGGSGSGHSNIDIEVRVNGTGSWFPVGNGAFNAENNYRFSGTFDADPYLGDSIEVRALSVGPWDNGVEGGQTWTTSAFTVDQNCNEEATPVDPVVTVSEVCGVADSLVVPNTPGVDYLLGQQVVNGETITGAASGTITAQAQTGFELADPSWSFAYDLEAGSPCPEVVTPANPTIVQSSTCAVQGSVTFPRTPGIRYLLGGVDVSGQTLTGPVSGTVTVGVLPGFVLSVGAPTQLTFVVAPAAMCDEVLAEEIEPDEVDDVVTLPFTGIDSEKLLGTSILLLAIGIYLIHFARRGEEG